MMLKWFASLYYRESKLNPYITTKRIELYAEEFVNSCMIKVSYIRHIGNKWKVFSEKGKVLGTYNTKAEATTRLKQIELFKHMNKKKSASKDISYSSIMRKLREDNDKEAINKFQRTFKDSFDNALISGSEKPEDEALEAAVNAITENSIEKAASAIDLGDANAAGLYLSQLIKFLLKRISPGKRQKSIDNLKKKIYYLNEFEIGSKRVPASSSLGQSITLLKTILLEHSPQYIREVLNSIVRNM